MKQQPFEFHKLFRKGEKECKSQSIMLIGHMPLLIVALEDTKVTNPRPNESGIKRPIIQQTIEITISLGH